MRLKITNILFASCIIALPIAGYFIGYARASSHEKRQIVTNLMYEHALIHQAADAAGMKNSTLNALLLGSTRNYQALLPEHAATNKTPLYIYAVTKSAEIESKLVPLSSIFPGANVTIKNTTPDGA